MLPASSSSSVISVFLPLSLISFVQDEVDALGTSRGNDGQTGAHEGVLTSLLNEMDGIQELFGVIVVAATNRPDVMVSLNTRPWK